MAGKKILVADDSLTIQKVIRLALSGDGYEIQTVSDGKEAVEQASLFRPDICIVDISLPQLDAYQVREAFLTKPDLQNIPVILMSSTFEKVDEGRSQSLGFAGHLVKPFDPSHLRSTLLAVINQSPKNDPITETITRTAPIRFDPPQIMNHDFPPLEMSEPAVDDIQQLAKNTFEMSGLNQHEWGMIEPGLSSTPPPPPSSTAGEVASIDFNELTRGAGYTETHQHQMTVTPQELEKIIHNEVNRVVSALKGQIQEQLEKEVLRFSETQMPAIAEKVLKEEIHKLLANPPL